MHGPSPLAVHVSPVAKAGQTTESVGQPMASAAPELHLSAVAKCIRMIVWRNSELSLQLANTACQKQLQKVIINIHKAHHGSLLKGCIPKSLLSPVKFADKTGDANIHINLNACQDMKGTCAYHLPP